MVSQNLFYSFEDVAKAFNASCLIFKILEEF